jgi:hypothetical protein
MGTPENALHSFQRMEAHARSLPRQEPDAAPIAPCPKKQKKIRLRIVVRDEYYRLCPKRRYVLTVGGEVFQGTTGANALVDHLVQPGATAGELQVWMDDSYLNARPLIWQLKIDDIDPLALDTGAETRLRNLGLTWEAEQSGVPSVRAKLEDFQGAFRLQSEDGTLDGATRSTLDETYSDQPIESVREHYYIWDKAGR